MINLFIRDVVMRIWVPYFAGNLNTILALLTV